jgi:hypothetical protein
MSVAYISEADRVRAALAAIPAGDYSTWVDMAFAVKHGLGEAGFDLWDAWSQTAPNYDARSARATWRSASESGAITLASLFWLAGEHGFDLAGSRAFGDRAARSASAHASIVGADASLERKRRARRAAVARQALSIWNWARPVAPDHPYLARKQIAPLPTLRELEAEELHVLLGYVPKSNDTALLGRVLIVPVRIGHQISTLELIDCEGRKSSLAGGAKAGGWWSVTPEQHRRDACLPVLIAEGVAGEFIYGLDAVPTEVKVAAERRFGAALRMSTPRENGGPYRGEVLNTEHFLVQEVAPRSVVFHAKGRMTFVSDRLRWMDEHHRLNGADVQIVYEGERAKLYPWDRARDQLERAVASLKKSAREMGLDGMDAKLDALHAASWARVKAARAAALAQARSRVDGRGDIDDPQR